MIKDEFNFGSGSFVGDIMAPEADFFELSSADQARYLGWVAACPVVEELIDPTNRGPEAMINRYASVAFWHGYIARTALHENPALGMRLSSPEARVPGEPVGRYEPESVPEGYDEDYSAVGKLVGHAVPRMFIEHVSLGQNRAERSARRRSGTEAVQDAASWSKLSEADFLARTAEGLAQAGTPPELLLRHIAAQGWLDEHNGKRMFDKAMLSLREHAPTVWAVYEGLSDEQRAEQKLAMFDPLDVEYQPSQEDLRDLFNDLFGAVKGAEITRSARSQNLNDFKNETRVSLIDGEAHYITQDTEVESVEVRLLEPLVKEFPECSINVRATYGQPGIPGRSSVMKGWTLYKSTSMTRGDEYALHVSPVEMYSVAGENELVPESENISNQTEDLDEDYFEDNTQISVDDVAMLHRLARTL